MCIESYTCGFYGKPVSARESIHLGTSQVSEYYEGNNGRKNAPKNDDAFYFYFFFKWSNTFREIIQLTVTIDRREIPNL